MCLPHCQFRFRRQHLGRNSNWGPYEKGPYLIPSRTYTHVTPGSYRCSPESNRRNLFFRRWRRENDLATARLLVLIMHDRRTHEVYIQIKWILKSKAADTVTAFYQQKIVTLLIKTSFSWIDSRTFAYLMWSLRGMISSNWMDQYYRNKLQRHLLFLIEPSLVSIRETKRLAKAILRAAGNISHP